MKNQSPLTELVRNYVCNNIEARKLRPGDAINFAALADTLNVSRTPIRESMRELHLDGLVESEPGGHVRVATLSLKDAEDFYVVRLELEVAAIEAATTHISDYELEMMRLNLQLFEESRDRPAELPSIDKMFHEIIYDSSHNQYLAKALRSLRVILGLFQDPAYVQEMRIARTLTEHKAIYNALKKRDAKRARDALTKHILNAKKSRTGKR